MFSTYLAGIGGEPELIGPSQMKWMIGGTGDNPETSMSRRPSDTPIFESHVGTIEIFCWNCDSGFAWTGCTDALGFQARLRTWLSSLSLNFVFDVHLAQRSSSGSASLSQPLAMHFISFLLAPRSSAATRDFHGTGISAPASSLRGS